MSTKGGYTERSLAPIGQSVRIDAAPEEIADLVHVAMPGSLPHHAAATALLVELVHEYPLHPIGGMEGSRGAMVLQCESYCRGQDPFGPAGPTPHGA